MADELQAPPDFDWYFWRLVLAEKIGASVREIEDWSLADAAEAHLALDLAEDTAILVDRRLNPPRPGTR